MEPDCWHSVVKITQVPNEEVKNERETTWLCDPLSMDEETESKVYCTKFTLDGDYFSWKFYLKEETKKKAIESGYCFLDYMQEAFPGLDGHVKVKPIYLQHLSDNKNFSELVLPEPPYRERIELIKKIVNFFCNIEEYKVKIYIFWQRSDDIIGEISDTELEKQHKIIEDYYKIKIFINSIPISPRVEKREDLKAVFEGHRQSLRSGIGNDKNERAKIVDRPSVTLENIVNFLVFFKNRDRINTGKYYRLIKEIIGEVKLPGFVNPKSIDFTIPIGFPLDQAKKIQNENIGFSSAFKNGLFLGYWIRNGVIKRKRRYLKFDDLLHHNFITGLTGVGKSNFCYHVTKELATKVPHVGLLIINIKKEEEMKFFQADINLKYKDLEVPYSFFDDEGDVSDAIEDFVPLLVAGLGLPPFIEHPFANSIKAYYDEHKTLPIELKDLFPPLLLWFKNKVKYDAEVNSRAVSAIENRAIRLLNSQVVKKVVRLRKDLPEWFREWKNGKNVFIDLTSCKSPIIKSLVLVLIFQMVKLFTPELHKIEPGKKLLGNLQYVIMVDEIGEFLARASSPNYYDDEHLAKYQIDKMWEDILGGFRSRGVALISVDNKPSRLFESVYSLPSIQVVFRTAHSCNHLFTRRLEEQEFLKGLEHRRAIVMDGVNGYKYEIFTPDFEVYDVNNGLKINANT